MDKVYLTTREVSQLLGVNEKKVYSLAQDGKLPGTKLTGKWIFPRGELEEHLRRDARKTIERISAGSKQIILLCGSDDPVMYVIHGLFHRQNPEYALFTSSVGSSEGLRLLKRGLCHIALSHLYDPGSGDYNFPFIMEIFKNPKDLTVINLFHRSIGFVSQKEIASFREVLAGKLRFVNRQAGSGIRNRIDHLLAEEGIEGERIAGFGEEVFTHHEVAQRILNGRADVGVASEFVAGDAQLSFHKLFDERFDLVVYRDTFFEKTIQVLLEFIRSDTFLKLLEDFRGYSGRLTGKVLFPE